MRRLLLGASAVALLAAAPAALAAPRTAASISIAVKSDTEHARKGPDGKWHDAFLPAQFAVHSGQRVTVTVRNYDGAVHTFTSNGLGLAVALKPGSQAHPSVTTFSFVAPAAGAYTWMCMAQCDPWAMTHLGFMRGRVTVLA